MEKIKASYASDEYWRQQKNAKRGSAVLHEEDGLVWHRFGLLYLPAALRKQGVMEAHRTAYSGHFGVDRVCAKLQESLWGPRMRQTVTTLLISCHECQ